jgi:Raf kinase inhibitor-like YbhB/YbcL family protein
MIRKSAVPVQSFVVPLLLVVVVAVCWTGGPALGGESAEKEEKTMALEITSSAFDPNGAIPAKHTCDGEDLSPALSWTGVPEGAKSLVLIMDDPDAPPGTWVHWVLYDLPADTSGLPEGLPKSEKLESGAAHGLCWGVSSFSRVGYYGPCPPPGSPHRYQFKLYALDAVLGLAPRAIKAEVLAAMEGHVLAQGELVGIYER